MNKYVSDQSHYLRQISERSSLFCDFSERFRCNLCTKILLEPIQTKCGCRFCLICIGNYINNREIECPNCEGEKIERDKLLKDKAVEKEIMNLRTKCKNTGCEREMEFRDINVHLKECEYKEEECEKCGERYRKKEKESHLKEKCRKGLMICEDCGEEVKREEFQSKHRNYEEEGGGGGGDSLCGMWLAECPYKCNEERLFNVRIHLKRCPNKPNQCPFKDLGCTKKGTQTYLKMHLEKDKFEHDMRMVSEIREWKRRNQEGEKETLEREERMRVRIKECVDKSEETGTTLDNLVQTMNGLEDHVRSISSWSMEGGSPPRSLGPRNLTKDLILGHHDVTWTIRDIRDKILGARRGGSRHISSECFYIRRPGYHMNLKVYPDGEGRALGEYLSVFFVINEGEYDGALSWPFRMKVAITLMSNSARKKDLIVRLRPDDNIGCYGRPASLSSSNLGAGVPHLVTLSELLDHNEYLHDGAIKIRLQVISGTLS